MPHLAPFSATLAALVRRVRHFRLHEAGAMTVDTVVVAAGVVGLGIAVLATLADGLIDTSAALSSDLEDRIDRDVGGYGQGSEEADGETEDEGAEDGAGDGAGGGADAGGGGDDGGGNSFADRVRRFLRWLFGG